MFFLFRLFVGVLKWLCHASFGVQLQNSEQVFSFCSFLFFRRCRRCQRMKWIRFRVNQNDLIRNKDWKQWRRYRCSSMNERNSPIIVAAKRAATMKSFRKENWLFCFYGSCDSFSLRLLTFSPKIWQMEWRCWLLLVSIFSARKFFDLSSCFVFIRPLGGGWQKWERKQRRECKREKGRWREKEWESDDMDVYCVNERVGTRRVCDDKRMSNRQCQFNRVFVRDSCVNNLVRALVLSLLHAHTRIPNSCAYRIVKDIIYVYYFFFVWYLVLSHFNLLLQRTWVCEPLHELLKPN